MKTAGLVVVSFLVAGGCRSLGDWDSGYGGHSALYESGTGTVLPVNQSGATSNTMGEPTEYRMDETPVRTADTVPARPTSRTVPTVNVPSRPATTRYPTYDSGSAARTPAIETSVGTYPHRVENSDATITAAIRQRISDAKVSANGRSVDVVTESAHVTLRGTVDSMEEKEAIARLARQVAGATRVDDRLDVVMAR